MRRMACFLPSPWVVSFTGGVKMARRRKRISRKKSRKSFTRGALRVHPKNTRSSVMRGGIRL